MSISGSLIEERDNLGTDPAVVVPDDLAPWFDDSFCGGRVAADDAPTVAAVDLDEFAAVLVGRVVELSRVAVEGGDPALLRCSDVCARSLVAGLRERNVIRIVAGDDALWKVERVDVGVAVEREDKGAVPL